jgi:hypothetical protein
VTGGSTSTSTTPGNEDIDAIRVVNPTQPCTATAVSHAIGPIKDGDGLGTKPAVRQMARTVSL